MKILLVCAAGCSTSMLTKKMQKYWDNLGIALTVKATGLSHYRDYVSKYDIVLVGPQVNYRLAEIKEESNKPCEAINSYDYAVGNCEAIYKLALKLYSQIQ